MNILTLINQQNPQKNQANTSNQWVRSWVSMDASILEGCGNTTNGCSWVLEGYGFHWRQGKNGDSHRVGGGEWLSSSSLKSLG